MKHVHRFEVPVDGLSHEHALSGDLVHVAARRPWTVEFWALTDTLVPIEPRYFQAFGTGDAVPEHAVWRGTALAPDQLVWHLFEIPAGAR